MSGNQQRTALVLGATGGIGGEVAAGLLARGWRVRALVRGKPAPAPAWRHAGVAPEWVVGDARDAARVAEAARGVGLIVHAVNPPGYRDWERLVLPMLDATIAAAERSAAQVLLPGTVYNYGPDAFPLIAEDAAQHARTRKGAIRVEMERRLEAASARGVRVLIVRCGDFFGPHGGQSWFANGLVRPGRRVTRIIAPGRRGVGHQWAYLPDAAAAMIQLIERAGERPRFERFHVSGHWDADGREMTSAIRQAVGRRVPIWPFPWWLVKLAAPAVPLFRELSELRYLWRVPVRLENHRLVATLGAEPHTPLAEAVRETLAGLGCLG